MQTSMTQHRLGTQDHRSEGAAAPAAHRRSPVRGAVSLAAGAFGVVAATLPAMGIAALLLAAVAIGVGVPVMRRGPGVPSFPFARVGVVLGMIAVLVGILSLAMQLLD